MMADSAARLSQRKATLELAHIDFILQAATNSFHSTTLKALLRREPQEVLINVAFVRCSGLDEVEDEIRNVADTTRMFVGVRNEITSIQAVKKLLELGVELYAVDTGSQSAIFHPKIYCIS